MKGNLYLIGVPIGNYEDLTFRALRILKDIDLILCEDTRETKNLLDNFLIQKPLISYVSMRSNAYNKAFDLLTAGKNVAFVSDRGMPTISDPGAEIVEYFRKLEIPIKIIPGVSSVTTAFALTGLTGGFYFHGFFPKNKNEIIKLISNNSHHHIFFESPYRLKKTLQIINDIMPDQIIYIARELTKTYEEFLSGTSEELMQKELKGEIVLII